MSKRWLCFGLSILIAFVIDNSEVFAYCHPQCLEYVQSQTNIGGGYGDANGLWNDIASRNNGWRRVAKGGSEQPHIGDIPYPGDVAWWSGYVAYVEKVDYDNNGQWTRVYIFE